jgi:hypothetical protein
VPLLLPTTCFGTLAHPASEPCSHGETICSPKPGVTTQREDTISANRIGCSSIFQSPPCLDCLTKLLRSCVTESWAANQQEVPRTLHPKGLDPDDRDSGGPACSEREISLYPCTLSGEQKSSLLQKKGRARLHLVVQAPSCLGQSSWQPTQHSPTFTTGEGEGTRQGSFTARTHLTVISRTHFPAETSKLLAFTGYLSRHKELFPTIQGKILSLQGPPSRSSPSSRIWFESETLPCAQSPVAD